MAAGWITLRLLETPKGRTLTIDGKHVAGPGGDAPVAVEMAIRRDALLTTLRDDARQPDLI